MLYKTNFDEVVEVRKGMSLNLTVAVFTNLSLTSVPVWSRENQQLYSIAVVKNFVTNEIFYTSFIIFNLSYVNDTGVYSLSVSNRCGSSSISVFIDVTGTNEVTSYIRIRIEHTHAYI